MPGGAPGAEDALDDLGEDDDADSMAVGAIETRAAPAPQRPTPARAAAPTAPPAARAGSAAAARRPGVGVGARRGSAVSSRRSTTLMELAAANYGHIRTDLARIGIIAIIMLGIIVALSFVLK